MPKHCGDEDKPNKSPVSSVTSTLVGSLKSIFNSQPPVAAPKVTYSSKSINYLNGHIKAAEECRKNTQYEQQLHHLNTAHDIYKVIAASGAQGIEDLSESSLLREIAGAHEHLLNYQEQIKCLHEALRVIKLDPGERLSEEHYVSNIIAILRRLGKAYGKIGDCKNQAKFQKEALEHQRKVVKAAQDTSGDTARTATALNTLGIFYGDEKNYEGQIAALFEALRIFREQAPEHPTHAIVLNNLGITYGILRDRSKQKAYLGQALKMYIKTVGVGHPYTKKVQENLATIYESETVKLFEKLRLSTSLILEEIMEKVEVLIQKILDMLPEQRTLKTEALLEYLLEFQEESMQHLAPPSMNLNPNPNPGPSGFGAGDESGDPCCCYGSPAFATSGTNLTAPLDPAENL